MNILEQWNEENPLTPEEQALVLRPLSHDNAEKSVWSNVPEYTTDINLQKDITQQYFDLMPFCNITTDTHKMLFNKHCSDFIRELFKIYVDDETLVISTDCEHPTVKECLANSKHTLILSQHNDIRKLNYNKINLGIQGYKKVFVYIISVRNDTGEITPQSFMIKLKEILKTKQTIMVLDAVQGMFLTPCDYSMYDYVLGTGHVIVPAFDMGMAICKKEDMVLDHGFICNWSKNYLLPLRIILNRLEKLYKFRYVCNEYFKNYITTDNTSLVCSVPYIFYIKADHAKVEFEKEIEKLHVLIMPKSTQVGGIRMRALGFINNSDRFYKAEKLFKYVLDTKELDIDIIKGML